ncbi:GNAT family N-acetyltransferase [Croceivirga thetidis]|uniref:GNAT family N-acetyltransferase n=1 Tax=Croceivirga thetidis TaxID=2721623 RepID=A0ABX1GUI3_9FLAO|nr:GNAT family N-acetyltransferase [Croceivirga thetidis]NKI32711.1 GNAT family N-acetyltransferase [Croceivirga thetidis]
MISELKKIRQAEIEDLPRCIQIRGQTKDNPISATRLQSMGITLKSWSELLANNQIIGFVGLCEGVIVGFCFADIHSGEVLVLAVEKDFDGLGFGKELLQKTSEKLKGHGFQKIWLAATPEPKFRAYGFYRHLGWKSTNTYDKYGDEILELKFI